MREDENSQRIATRAPMDLHYLLAPALGVLLVGTLLFPTLRDGAALAVLGLLFARHPPGRGGLLELLPLGWAGPIALYVVANLSAAVFAPDPAAALSALALYPIGLLIFVGTAEVVHSE